MTENKIKYVVWDVETTTHTSFKRKANPFDPENFVVMSGYRRNGGDIVGEYFGTKKRPDDWFIKLLQDTTLLVGQNIKFDILTALNDSDSGPANRLAWMAFIARGGNIWDVQLAEYLLNGMTQVDHMLSLDEMALRYGGNVKIDEVKALWNAGVDTVDIDRVLLSDYLIGRTVNSGEEDESYDHGDIGNTELVWLGQYERAKAAGQVKSILVNMGSLLCTTEMEMNGMAVDKELGIQLAGELEQTIAALSIKVNAYLPDDLPFQFNWGSGPQKSALIFGGTVKYDKWLPHLTEDGEMQYAQKDEVHIVLDDGTTAPMPVEDEHGIVTIPAGAVFYQSGKNKGELKTKKVKVDNLEKPKGAIQKVPYEFPGFTKPNPEWQGKVEGVYSTSGEVLESLGNRGVPFLEDLSKLTGLRKDLTTYFITVNDKGETVGMLTLVQADGIIHHMLNHTSTVTGRFSSSSPNLQNIPKGNKSKAKLLFVSRFQNGKVIQSDFSSLEVYVQAILTKCVNLINDLRSGIDLHSKRVAQKEGIPYEEALKLCKGYITEAGDWVDAVKEWDIKRTKAKIFSFQRAYGAGAGTIADETGLSMEEVEAIIQAEREMYPETETFFERLTMILESRAEPTEIFLMHPHVQGAKINLKAASYRTPDNKLYMWREEPAPKWLATRSKERGGRLTSFSPTQIKNYPVQGAGGEWAKAAMWLAIRYFAKMQNWGGLGLLVNQVHDALYADADDSVAFEVAVALHACMEEASTFMEWYFGWEIPVHVPSDTNWGPNMMDTSVMPDGFKEAVIAKRGEIRKLYINNYQPKHGLITETK